MSSSDPHNDYHNQYINSEFHEVDPEDTKTEQERKEEQGLEDARNQNKKKELFSNRGVGLIILTFIFIIVIGVGVWGVAILYSDHPIVEVSLKGREGEQANIHFLCTKDQVKELNSLLPDIEKETLRQEDTQLKTLRKELNKLKTEIEEVKSSDKRQTLIERYNRKQNTLIEMQEELEKKRKRYNTQVQEYNTFLKEECEQK